MWLLCTFGGFTKNLGTPGHIVNRNLCLSANSLKYQIQHSGFGTLPWGLCDHKPINGLHSFTWVFSHLWQIMWHATTKVKWDGQNAVSFMPYNSSRSIKIDAKTFKILNQMQRLNPRGLNKDTDIFEYLDGDTTVTEQEYSQPSCKWVKIALKAISLGVWGKNSHSFLSSSPSQQ